MFAYGDLRRDSGVDFGEHQKKTIPLAWLVSLVMVVVAILTRGIAI